MWFVFLYLDMSYLFFVARYGQQEDFSLFAGINLLGETLFRVQAQIIYFVGGSGRGGFCVCGLVFSCLESWGGVVSSLEFWVSIIWGVWVLFILRGLGYILGVLQSDFQGVGIIYRCDCWFFGYVGQGEVTLGVGDGGFSDVRQVYVFRDSFWEFGFWVIYGFGWCVIFYVLEICLSFVELGNKVF